MRMPTLTSVLKQQQKRQAQEKEEAERQEAKAGQLLEELRADAEGVRNANKTAIQREQTGRQDWRDPRYWFAVTFESRDQKLAVLAALGLPMDNEQYISGTDLIRALKLNVPEISREPHRLKENRVWKEFT